MSWEIYTKERQTKSTNPTITISRLGRCTLNKAAATQFDKEATQNVLLLWDREMYKVALRPITKKDPRAFSLRYARAKESLTGAAFSGVMFLRHINYDFTSTKTYPITWNAEESIFEVTLPKERFHNEQQPLLAVEGGKKHGKTATGN